MLICRAYHELIEENEYLSKVSEPRVPANIVIGQLSLCAHAVTVHLAEHPLDIIGLARRVFLAAAHQRGSLELESLDHSVVAKEVSDTLKSLFDD